GMIGQWLAVHARERLTHLVIANSSPRPDAAAFETRRRAVLDGGLAPIEPLAMGRFFSPAFLAANSAPVTWARRTLLGTDPVGYAGCCAAIRDMDMRDRLHEIGTPTLVICGTLDIPMPWTGHSEVLADGIAGSVAVRLPAAHISNLETPRSFSAALHAFLMPPAPDPLAAGFAVRRAVLGDTHVDRAAAATTPFTAAFQDLITRYAWGTIWTRPGLDPRTSTRRLRGVAPDPLVGGHGVPPEVLLLDGSRLRQEVLLRNCKDRVDWCHAVAVGPVAAEEDAVFSEHFQQPVEPGAIGAEV